MLPPHRQMFYQLCDLDEERYQYTLWSLYLAHFLCIHLECTNCVPPPPSIRQVVDQNSGEEEVCDERDGWCLPGTKDKLRDMMSVMIKKVIKAQSSSKR